MGQAILYIVPYATVPMLQGFMITIGVPANAHVVTLTYVLFVLIVMANVASLPGVSTKRRELRGNGVAGAVGTLASAVMGLSVFLVGQQVLAVPGSVELRPLITSLLFQVLLLLTIHAQLGTGIHPIRRGRAAECAHGSKGNPATVSDRPA